MNKLTIILFALLLSSCFNKDNDVVTINNSVTSNKIVLTGRVLDKNNAPVEGIVAKLAVNGFADTTDSDGQYFIEGELPDEVLAKLSAAEVLDTVIISRVEQQITSIDVVEWVDTLPDVKIAQRDFSGELANKNNDVGKVEAVLTGDGISEDDPIIAEFFYNDNVNEYSGFIYFPATNDKQNFEIYINIYNSEGKFTGRSETIDFNSLAGDITISTFSSLGALPMAFAGKDTIVSIKDTIILHGEGTDTFDGKIVAWEWSIGGPGFGETSMGDSAIIAPDTENTNYICIFRVTDDDGNIAADTIIVKVLEDAPILSIEGYTTVAINTPITLKALVTQSFGEIVQYRWDDGITPGFDDSTGVEFIVTYQEEKTFTVNIEVEDDDWNKSTSTHTIVVTNDTPILTGLKDTTISINDILTFTVEATDSQGIVKSYYWNFGDESENQFDTTTAASNSHKFPSIAGQFTVEVTVVDTYDKSSTLEAKIDVILDPPNVNAGLDTIISINDSIYLHGSATDGYGTIIKWEWDVGNTGNFVETTPDSEFIVIASDNPNNNFICVIKVTDDDGNQRKDTVKVTVLLDAPIVSINDTTVLIKDSLELLNSTSMFCILLKHGPR